MVNKTLADEVMASCDTDMSSEQVRKVCETFLSVILTKVKAGEPVVLTNFLKFERVLNKERTFSIPNSDKTTTKPARYGLKVRIMTNVKTAFEAIHVNDDSDENEAVVEPSDEEKEVPKGKGKGKAVSESSDEEKKVPKGKGKGKAVSESSDEEKEVPKGKGKGGKGKTKKMPVADSESD
jgi:nucleoid DNA-binding protein